MKVLLFSPLAKWSGNQATTLRIKEEFEKNNIQCYVKCPSELGDCQQVQNVIEDLNIDIILAVHIYKSGRFLQEVKKPYIMILGGTDVNELTKDEEKMAVMDTAVNRSSHIVAFSESLAQKFKSCWPNYDQQKVSIIPQGVKVSPSNFSLEAYIHKYTVSPTQVIEVGTKQEEFIFGCELDVLLDQLKSDSAKLLTVVGGIRHVKNPLFLIQKFSDWRLEAGRQDCWLLFIGAHHNDDYYERFKGEILSNRGVVYIPGLPIEDTHTVIQKSLALVNCSESEGMALAILEAMSLSTPVLVRNIPANSAIVSDHQTGLIYDTPEDFLKKVEYLLDSPVAMDTISKNAHRYISQNHSMKFEEDSYISLVKQYCEI